MATDAFNGGWGFKLGNGADPEVFTELEEVTSIGEVGKTRNQVDVTHFSSPNKTREFISGLAQGDEITIECNYILQNNTQQQSLIANVDQGDGQRNVEIEVTDGVNTVTLGFTITPLGYKYAPNLEEANKITFTAQISGDITIT